MQIHKDHGGAAWRTNVGNSSSYNIISGQPATVSSRPSSAIRRPSTAHTVGGSSSQHIHQSSARYRLDAHHHEVNSKKFHSTYGKSNLRSADLVPDSRKKEICHHHKRDSDIFLLKPAKSQSLFPSTLVCFLEYYEKLFKLIFHPLSVISVLYICI